MTEHLKAPVLTEEQRCRIIAAAGFDPAVFNKIAARALALLPLYGAAMRSPDDVGPLLDQWRAMVDALYAKAVR
jgi:hypothetical protein